MLQKQLDTPENYTFFWNSWQRSYKTGYLIGLVFFFLVLLVYVWGRWNGNSLIIQWEQQSSLEAVPVILDTFTQGLYNFPVEGSNYLVTEKFLATPFLNPVGVREIWLFVSVLSLLALLTSVTYLPRLWFAVGMTLFVGTLIGFRLENLQLFGFTNQTGLGVAMLLYLPLAYYFHEYNRRTSYFIRFGVFAGITVFFGLLIFFFAKNPAPVVFLAGYGVLAPIILTLLFIIMVAHENIIAIVNITSRSGSRMSFIHFVLLSLVYLISLILVYLKNRLFIDWNIVYLDAFVVLGVSAIAGIWGFRRQSRYFSNVLPFFPQGAFFYLGLATLSLATITFFFATANDPMLEMIEDTILYTHIGLGFAFLIYVSINFFPLYQQGLPVIKVVYEPPRLGTMVIRGAGIIVGIIFFQVAERLPLYQGIAGYENNVGDAYMANSEYMVAEEYYKSAINRTGLLENHKSDYALFSLATLMQREDGEGYYLKNALLKNPLPQTYVALSSLYESQQKFFDALFVLQDGIRRFPEEGRLHNNIALLYGSKSITDSANVYFDKAEKYLSNPDVVKSNRLAMALRTRQLALKDTASLVIKDDDYLPLKANKIAFLNLSGKPEQNLKVDLPKDTVLTRENFALWFNCGLHKRFGSDSLFFNQLKLAESAASNFIYSEDLRFARAFHEYVKGDKMLAFNLLSVLQNSTATQPAYFSRMLGLWFSQNGAYQRAIEYFDKAITKGDTLSYLNRIIALAEMGKPDVALGSLLEHTTNDPTAQSLQNVLQALLDNNRQAAVAKLNDQEKAFFVHFANSGDLISATNNIGNEDFKILATTEIAEKLLKNNQYTDAEKVLQPFWNQKPTQKATTLKLNYLKTAIRLKDAPSPQKIKELESISFPPEKEAEKWIMKANYFEISDLVKAELNYREAIRQMPLSEEAILQASRFLSEKRKKPIDAYNILLNSIQLNPYSADLYKAYILQALQISSFTYAEIALQDLRTITSPADYQAFEQVYQTKKAFMQKEREAFQ